MSICSDCHHTKPVARCVTNLIIGTISSLATAVKVFIADKTTEDRIIEYSLTTSAAGLITIPITPQRFSEDHSYEVWVTLTTADNINVRQNITIGTDVANCVDLQFETVWKNDNTIATYTNQTLTL
jgi:hypothetical protein